MARSVSRVAMTASKRHGLKTKGKTELAIGLLGADAFSGKNRCLATNAVHEVDGSGNGALLMCGRVGLGQEELTSGDSRGWRRWRR